MTQQEGIHDPLHENFRDTWPGWATVESEPAIFSSLLNSIGVTDLTVEEVYSLDRDSLDSIAPLGLIFLFRWKDETDVAGVKREELYCPEDIWFANQVIENACASLALLNIVLNLDVNLGPHLTQFKDFTAEFSPPLRGLTLTNFTYLRQLHNSFAKRSEMLNADLSLMQDMKSKGRGRDDSGGEECFHFVAYIHKRGCLWELDGLKRAPVKLGDCKAEEWSVLAAEQIQARMARYQGEEEIRFNLLAICRSLEARRLADGEEESESALRERLVKEEEAARYAIRRRHDYTPLIQKMLALLNEKDVLRQFIE